MKLPRLLAAVLALALGCQAPPAERDDQSPAPRAEPEVAPVHALDPEPMPEPEPRHPGWLADKGDIWADFPERDLTMAQRRGIYRLLHRAGNRAHTEAEARFPLPPIKRGYDEEAFLEQSARLHDEASRLEEIYTADLARRWQVPYEQLIAILWEGLQERWPYPGFNPPR